jgi:predicted CoA-binding protein
VTTTQGSNKPPGVAGAVLSDHDLRGVLEWATTIAVVGASTHSEKESYKIPAILISAGFDVIPVHPSASEIHGRTAYRALADVPRHVDIVDVFRPADEAPGIAEQAVAIGADVLWLQAGIISEGAARIATEGGLGYVEDRCIGATTRLLGIRKTAG